MNLNYSLNRTSFGVLPEPERSPASFIASTVINGLILAVLFIIGAMARQVVVEHTYENTVLIFPPTLPHRTAVELPKPPKIKPSVAHVNPPKITLPRPQPDVKPIEME